MKHVTTYDHVPLWKRVSWTQDRQLRYGHERTRAHEQLLLVIGKCMSDGATVTYVETEPFPHTYATVRIVHGTEDRKPKAGATSKREDTLINDPVGTKRLRKDNVRSDGTGRKVIVDVGRQRKRKPRTPL